MSDYFQKQHGQNYYINPKTNRNEKTVEKKPNDIKGKEEYEKPNSHVIIKRYAIK